MNMTPRMEHGLVLFLVVMFLVPCALIILVSEEASYYPVASDPALPATQLAGYTVTGVRDTTWNVPGAEGGKTFTLTDPDGKTIIIDTQAFDSADARDAAIRRHNANIVGRGKQVGSLLVYGQYVVYVTPANHPILQAIGTGAGSSVLPP